MPATSRYADHAFVDVPNADRPEIARLLLTGARSIGADHQDPTVLATTSDGFRVRNDVLEASGLRADAAPSAGATSGASSAKPEDKQARQGKGRAAGAAKAKE